MSDQPVPSIFEVSKTSINVALTKAGINYQKLIQEIEDIKFSKDDLPAGQAMLEPAKKAKKQLDALVNPYTAQWKAWNEAMASVYDPLDEALSRQSAELKRLNKEVKEETAKLAAEETRKTNIQTAITNFTLEYSTKIAAATTNDDLVALQKRIGTEKSRSGFYQEFLPDLTRAVEELETALKTQKEHIKQLDALKSQQTAAEVAGDDEKVMELLDKQGTITAKIEGTKAGVQEQAVNRATAFTPRQVTYVAPVAAKAKKTLWSWEIVDMEAFAKRHPNMVTMQPIPKEIDAMIRDLKANGTITEGTFYGLKIFQKEYF